MRTLKGFVVLVVAGGVVGVVVATIVAPRIFTWYATPGGTAQALCDCASLAREVMGQLVRGQLVGMAAGAALFLLLGIVVKVSRKRTPSSVARAARHGREGEPEATARPSGADDSPESRL